MRFFFCLLSVVMMVSLAAPLGAKSPSPPSAKVPASLQLAKLTKEQILAKEVELSALDLEMTKTIEAALDRYEPGKIEQAVDSLKTFRPYVGQLKTLADELSSKWDRQLAIVVELKGTLADAPETFRAAGRQFRIWAEEERFKGTKEDYLLLADSWDAIAESIVHRQKTLSQEEEDVKKMGEYVTRTGLFLERFELFLDSVGDFPNTYERSSYTSQINKYVKGFQELRRLMRKLHDNVKGDAEKSRKQGEQSEPERRPQDDLEVRLTRRQAPRSLIEEIEAEEGRNGSIPSQEVSVRRRVAVLSPRAESGIAKLVVENDDHGAVSKSLNLQINKTYPVETADGQVYGTVIAYYTDRATHQVIRKSGGPLRTGLIVRETAIQR